MNNGDNVSRQQQLESAAQLVGNAAAHIVLYQDPSGIREALEYLGQAAIRITARSWNDEELNRFLELALRRSAKEIQERTDESRGRKYDEAIAEAASLIEQFIQQRML